MARQEIEHDTHPATAAGSRPRTLISVRFAAELERHRETMTRSGHGIKAIEAIARRLT